MQALTELSTSPLFSGSLSTVARSGRERTRGQFSGVDLRRQIRLTSQLHIWPPTPSGTF